jgi:hypothetical protein
MIRGRSYFKLATKQALGPTGKTGGQRPTKRKGQVCSRAARQIRRRHRRSALGRSRRSTATSGQTALRLAHLRLDRIDNLGEPFDNLDRKILRQPVLDPSKRPLAEIGAPRPDIATIASTSSTPISRPKRRALSPGGAGGHGPVPPAPAPWPPGRAGLGRPKASASTGCFWARR